MHFAACPHVVLTCSLLALSTLALADDEPQVGSPNKQPTWALVALEGTALKITTFVPTKKTIVEVVNVPMVAIEIVDGKKQRVVKQKAENRTRVVTVLQPKQSVHYKYVLRHIDGRRVSEATMRALQGKSEPAVFVVEGGELEDFFKRVLKPSTLVVSVAKGAAAEKNGN